MIEFKITHCPEKAQITSYRHMSGGLTFGNNTSGMKIEDPAIEGEQFKIYFEGLDTFILNTGQLVDMKMNDMPLAKVPTKFTTPSIIECGQTKIKFTEASVFPPPKPDNFEHPDAKTRFTAGTEENAILGALDFLFKEAPEDPVAVAPPPPPRPPLPPGKPPSPPPPPKPRAL